MSHDTTTAPLSPPEAVPTVERLAPADGRVPYDLAAKALDVSRRTVERMVSDGRLERDTSASDAPTVARVTRRSLVAALGDRRDASTTTPRHDGPVSSDSTLDVAQLVADLIDARAQAARLDEQVKLLAVGADDARRRDDLIATLVAGSWRERRKARREAIAALASRS
jgi:hypothetical protein